MSQVTLDYLMEAQPVSGYEIECRDDQLRGAGFLITCSSERVGILPTS